ncbi:MAG TPA: hypothetical protein VHF25_17320 [Nitriliruptorales bacterium]|nr:hypothetical protein [Nitriliruptorales bacterium]
MPAARLRTFKFKHWLFLGTALLLVAAAPAFACAPQTKAQAEPARAEAGSVTTVHGTGFDTNGVPVDIYWGGQNGLLLATANADAQGSFSVQVTIPADAQPGNYWLQAVQGQARTANFEFEVVSSEPDQGTQPEQGPPPQQGTEPEQGTQPEQGPQPEQPPGEAELPQGVYEPAATTYEEPAPQPAQQDAQPAQQSQPTRQEEPASAAARSSTDRVADVTSRAGAEASTSIQDNEPAAPGAAAPVQQDAPAATQPHEQDAALPPATAPQPSRVAPMPLTGDLGEARSVPVGPSPLFLVPLAAVTLGLLLVGGAIAVHELRQRGAEAKVPQR